MEIRKADLEDVFLDVMRPGASRWPRERRTAAGGAQRTAQRGSVPALALGGWQTLLYKEVLRFWKVGFQTVAAPVLTAVLYLLIFGHVLEDHVQGLRPRSATPPSWCPGW